MNNYGLLIGIPTGVVLVSAILQCWVFNSIGYSWWVSLIPFYRNCILLREVGYSPWWAIATIIPGINIAYFLSWRIATHFRLFKGFGFSEVVSAVFAVFSILGVIVCIVKHKEFGYWE